MIFGEIFSDKRIAEGFKKAMATLDNEMKVLYGVDGDNTLAESGIYYSHNNILRPTYNKFVSQIEADCENLVKAAELFSELDRNQSNQM